MQINLSPPLEEMLRAKVASGQYASASEVVRDALRLLEEEDRVREAKLERMQADIKAGLDSGAGEPWDREGMKRQGAFRRNAALKKAEGA